MGAQTSYSECLNREAALGERGPEANTTCGARDPLLEVCRALGEYQGIVMQAPEWLATDHTRPLTLVDLCETNGVRHRNVRLRDSWWRCDLGPLLAYRTDLPGIPRQPVALLPSRKNYRLVDPTENVNLPVTPAVAAGLEVEAVVLYRPLPSQRLTIIDLLRAGLHGQARDVSILALASLGSGGLALLTPLLTRWIVDSSIVHSDRVELCQMIAALVIGALAVAFLDLTRALTLLRLKSKTAVSLQAALWDRMLALPVSFFRRFSVGDLTARSMGIDQIQHFLTGDVTGALFALFSATFSLAILFRYSWPLALVATGSAALLGLITAVLARYQLRHLRSLHAINGALSSLVYSLLGGIAKLRLGCAERRAFTKWAERFSEQRRHAISIRRVSNLQPVAALAITVGSSLAFFAMIAFSSRMGLGVGEYLAFNAAYAQFQAAALAAIAAIPTALSAIPAQERMRPILETMPESYGGQVQPHSLRGELELRHVSFRYADGPVVLDDVSVLARPGEFVAIVGPSGSGKSTCLRLLLGFEQPQSGAVMIDGTRLDLLNMHAVRRDMGVVAQNGRPLVGDIFHNIIGSLPLTLEDAWRAARFVGLDEEIRSMPMNMFTVVNARGVTFSGGQRQRLLLARAVVRRPRVLLLDEATSALDNRTQDLIARNLAELGATRVVIAHRLSTIRYADRIYVLDRGRIVEQGTFDELRRRGNLFARMAKRQML